MPSNKLSPAQARNTHHTRSARHRPDFGTHLVHVKLNQERSGGRQPFAQVAPLSNVGDILLLDVQALQPTNGLGARGHLGVPSFQITADDLDAPAVVQKLLDNISDGTEPLAHASGEVPDTWAGQVVTLEFKFGQAEQVNCKINVHGFHSFQQGTWNCRGGENKSSRAWLWAAG